MDISSALSALEALSSSPSTSSSGPLNVLLEDQLARARKRIEDGEDVKVVIGDLQKSVLKAKKDVQKGLAGWYTALQNVGKAVENTYPPNLAAVSEAYDHPPLFSEGQAPQALDRIIMDSLGRRGIWEAVEAMEEEAEIQYDPEKRTLSEQLHNIISEIERGDVTSALAWCSENATFLQSPPHPSPLPYHLHRSVFLSISDPNTAIAYARQHLMTFVPTQPVLQLITSCLYPPSKSGQQTQTNGVAIDGGAEAQMNGTNGTADGDDIEMDVKPKGVNGFSLINGTHPSSKPQSPYAHEAAPLIGMFKAEFCRRYGWPKEDPLEVVVDLGSRGGALNVIEKARRVMGERLGPIRSWEELPMEVPLPPSRRYHSVFVCPVSKEQATETNPPNMLTCGHVIAADSFNRLIKGGRRTAKCPYCPQETSQNAVQRLYF